MKKPMMFFAPDDGMRAFTADAFAKAMAAEKQAEIAAPAGDPPPAPEVKKEDAPPETKPVAAAPAEDDLPENLPNEGRSEKWKQFRQQYQTVRDERKKLQADLEAKKTELAEFEGTKKEWDTLKAQIKSLEEERAKWTEIHSIAQLERSPGFQEQFVVPRNEAVSQLKELAGYAEISPDAIQAAMAKTGKAKFDAMEELLGAAPSTLRGRIERLIDQIETLDTGAAKERQNAEQSIQARESRAAQEQRQRQEAFHKEAMSIFDTVAEEMKDAGLSKEDIAEARKTFAENKDLKVAAQLVLKARKHDLTAAQQTAMAKELEEAKAELARLKKASPGVESGGGQQQQTNTNGSFADGAKAIFRTARAA